MFRAREEWFSETSEEDVCGIIPSWCVLHTHVTSITRLNVLNLSTFRASLLEGKGGGGFRLKFSRLENVVSGAFETVHASQSKHFAAVHKNK